MEKQTKTPEENKRGLALCKVDECFGEREDCPYAGDPALCVAKMCDDVLAYIQQLEQRVPRWISVEERLPEDDSHYLVWAHDNGAEEVALYYGDGEWLTDDLENITRVVTHWMPLPEPPEEGDDEG